MDSLPIQHRLRRLWNKFRVLGFKQVFRSVQSFFLPKELTTFPLAGADRDLVLVSGVGETKREEAGKDHLVELNYLPKY